MTPTIAELVAMCRRVADAAVHALIEALRGEGTEAREDNEAPVEWTPMPRSSRKEGDVLRHKGEGSRWTVVKGHSTPLHDEAAEAPRVPEWDMWTAYGRGDVVQRHGCYFRRSDTGFGFTAAPAVSGCWEEVRPRTSLTAAHAWEPVRKEGKE